MSKKQNKFLSTRISLSDVHSHINNLCKSNQLKEEKKSASINETQSKDRCMEQTSNKEIEVMIDQQADGSQE